MLMKYNYLLAYLFVYINLINNVFCCNPTTLTIWKDSKAAPEISQRVYLLEARLEVRNEGSSEFTKGDKKVIAYSDYKNYQNMFSKDKKFGLYASWSKEDLTYTWNGKSQYLEKAVDVQKKGTKSTYTYYGCV